MRVVKLELHNWIRFAGRHVLDLGPVVYGVVARFDEDPERSNWGGKCLGGKTVVYDSVRGPMPIASFVSERRSSAMGLRGGKVVPVPVVGWHRNGVKPIVRVALRDGSADEYGAEHPILTSRGFVQARDLIVGDSVAKAGSLAAMGAVGALSVEDAEMIGLVTGDGVREPLDTFAFTADYGYKRDEFARVAGLVFPGHVVSDSENMRVGSLAGGRHGPRDESGSAAMRAWLGKVGLTLTTAAHKRLPPSLMEARRSAVIAALRTLWLTDGYVGMATKAECSYTSASEGLVHDVRYLLLRIGVQSIVSVKYVDATPYWTVKLTRASLRSFAATVEISGPKGEALRALVARAVPFRKPNVDVLPYEVWSRFELKTCVRKPDGRLRSITSWRADRRGMSRDVFLEFGGPVEVADGSVRWEPVIAVDDAGEAETFDITLDSEEHVYVAGRSFVLTHNSSVMGAFRFALFGTHPAETEDGWIYRGAEEGSVVLSLDDGTVIDRSRKLGKSTQLRVHVPGRVLAGAEAQAEIERRVGLDDKDFVNVCYFEQKKFARFISSTPGARMEIVRAWLGLDPLYGARDRVAAQLRAATKDEAQAESRLAGEGQRERDALAVVGGVREGLAERLAEVAARATRSREATTLLERANAEASQRRQDASDLARWESIRRELKDAPTGQRGATADLVPLRRKYDEAAGQVNEARRQAGQAQRVAAGEFDGACPVLAGFDCPAADEINGKRDESRLEAVRARARLEAAQAGQEKHERALNAAQAAEREEQRRQGQLDALAAEAKRLEPAALRAARWAGLEPENVTDELVEARAEVRAAEREAIDLERAIAAVAEGDRRKAALAGDLAVVRGKLAANAEALAVLALARRTIASEALDQIAARANGLLADAGFGLSMEVSWFREIRGQLATSCESCGAAFPSSQRVKVCEGCGAERGPKLAEELELRASARSGAADDLVSMAFCLAAGAWLRTQRGSGWEVCFLDEPAAALDATHRRLLAAHLQAMLASRHGFSQGFVVSHEQGFVENLPGLVIISAGPEASSVTVSR